MHKTPFMNSSIKEVDFSNCDLSNSSFKNSDLSQTTFNNTNLRGVDFRTAKNYSINPEINSIAKAKFSLEDVAGLLPYNIEIE